jgi:hypothetical protein
MLNAALRMERCSPISNPLGGEEEEEEEKRSVDLLGNFAERMWGVVFVFAR